VVIFATWFGVVYNHRSPVNWIGMSTVTLAFLFYATRNTLPADVLGSIGHLTWVRRLMRVSRRWRSALKFEEERLVKPRPAPSAPKETVRSAPSPASAQPEESPAHVES
jgi:hypothetical protein